MNFQINERATIGSILKAIRDGNKVEHIAKAIDGISQKPLLSALKEAGYVYSNKAPQGWHYVGEGAEPTEKSIFEYVNASSSNVKHTTKVNKLSQTIHTDFTLNNTEVASSTEVSPVIQFQFTLNEMTDLGEMLQEWRMKKMTEPLEVSQKPKQVQVHERIKKLPQGNTTRKTIVIDKTIGKRFDEYCKAERVNKSDILHLALLDFLNDN
ncbi:hypothetical protein [Lysinibacillus xylanilyticus]|uniref:CopG family transcriptional regulator n=1 Tax=Lysinibacillus xylanilyticus TaxID=582475 RepID=A0ABT4EWC6_9BACI|nr:hypothetical protein [Lysinibacillus xylanilyticus]MCY9549982.1 hypothetical protein [Lysinibacillus xylanilyticus]